MFLMSGDLTGLCLYMWFWNSQYGAASLRRIKLSFREDFIYYLLHTKCYPGIANKFDKQEITSGTE